jgi:hypothetical protein
MEVKIGLHPAIVNFNFAITICLTLEVFCRYPSQKEWDSLFYKVKADFISYPIQFPVSTVGQSSLYQST